jgi:hypothetical protein
MSIVREMRERQTMTAAPERSGLGGTLLIGCAAFAIGAIAIVGWKMWPGLKTTQTAAAVAGQPSPTSNAPGVALPTFSGKRLGEAEHAPLLRICIKKELAGDMDPQGFYKMITLASTFSNLGSIINPKEFKNGGEIAVFWNMIAECVYQQNSWSLCDPDNRQLAVTSASGSIREGARLAGMLSKHAEGKSSAGQKILALNTRAREQVLNSLRTRVRNGYLIAADFGFLPPPEIKAILAQTKTVANGCAKQ